MDTLGLSGEGDYGGADHAKPWPNAESITLRLEWYNLTTDS